MGLKRLLRFEKLKKLDSRESVPELVSVDSSPESDHSSLVTSSLLPQVPFGWEVRYDPVLGEYYYVNQINNLIQLDHPDEVSTKLTRHKSSGSLPQELITTKNRSYLDMALDTHYLLANGTGVLKTYVPEPSTLVNTGYDDTLSVDSFDVDLDFLLLEEIRNRMVNEEVEACEMRKLVSV